MRPTKMMSTNSFFMKRRRRRGSTSPPLVNVELNPGPKRKAQSKEAKVKKSRSHLTKEEKKEIKRLMRKHKNPRKIAAASNRQKLV